jgi:hypothetical protein
VLTSINELDGKIFELEDLYPEENYSKELEKLVIQHEEPPFNDVFEKCKT